MKTAREMYDFCSSNGYTVEKPAILEKCCNGLVEILNYNEDVTLCFMGVNNYVSLFSYDGFYLYAVTNQRLIMITSTLTGCKHRDFPSKSISHVDYTAGVAFAKLQIDISDVGKLIIGMNEISAKDITRRLHESFFAPKVNNTSLNSSISRTDELIKLKSLLDSGVLTEDEFSIEKKKILDQEPNNEVHKDSPQSNHTDTFTYNTCSTSNVPPPATPNYTSGTHFSYTSSTQSRNSAWEERKKRKKWWTIALIVLIIGCIIVQVVSNEKYSNTTDGKCDICGEPSSWRLDGHEYCDRHAGDKMQDDFYDKYGN